MNDASIPIPTKGGVITYVAYVNKVDNTPIGVSPFSQRVVLNSLVYVATVHVICVTDGRVVVQRTQHVNSYVAVDGKSCSIEGKINIIHHGRNY